MTRLHLNLHEAAFPHVGAGQFEWQIATGLWRLGRYKIDAVAHRKNVKAPFKVRRGFFPRHYFFASLPWHRWCPFSYNTLVGDFWSDVSIFFSNTLPELRIRGKVIGMIYDLIPFRVPELMLQSGYSKSFLANYCRQHEYLVQHADKVVTISDYSRRDIAKEFGISENDIPVVPCGVNAVRFAKCVEGDASEEEVKVKYGLPDRFVLYFGTTAAYKNVANLIRGYARMSDVVRRNIALVVTNGNEELRRVAGEEGVASQVKFLGYVDEADKPSLYRLASAYGFLSRIEGFGLTPLEAMAAGVPTLVSNCATLPEVVGDGALVVGPDDLDGIAAGFERLLEDGAFRGKLVEKGRRRAAEFTWEAAVQKMAEVIDSL